MSAFKDLVTRGLRSAQPAAAAVAVGTLYFVTDESVTERSSGTAWETYSSTTAAGITTLTGDVTAGPGAGSQVATVGNDKITYAKMQNVSAVSKLLGRGSAAGAGDPEEITLGTGLTMAGTTLNASVSAGTVDTSGTPATGNLTKFTDADTITNANLTGDVTTAGGVATTIAADAVTYAKMQNISAASKLLGRGDSGAGDPQEITLGTGLAMTGTTLSATGGGGGTGGGQLVQVVNTETGAMTTGTTVIPHDDTIPQNTEGDEYMTLAITPTSVTNKLRIDVVVHASASLTGNWVTAAIFQDTVANAVASSSGFDTTATGYTPITFTHYMTAGTTAATTFKVRVGMSSAGTLTFNGTGGARRFGGVLASSITISEIKPGIGSGGGASGSLVLLESHTASASATLDFTTRNATGQSGATFQSDYDEYLVELISLVPATDAVDFYWRFSTDGGSTFDAGSHYVSTILAWILSVTATAGEDPGGPVAQFAMRKSNVISNNGAYGLDGKIRIAIPGGGTKFPRCLSDFGFVTNTLTAQAVTHRGIYMSATAINAVRFLMSSGNIASGIGRIYGVAKT